jgi:hypothetical protein
VIGDHSMMKSQGRRKGGKSPGCGTKYTSDRIGTKCDVCGDIIETTLVTAQDRGERGADGDDDDEVAGEADGEPGSP